VVEPACGLTETLTVRQRNIKRQFIPEFAAFDLLRRPEGYAVLRRYYENYIAVTRKYRLGFVLESPTWCASRDWGRKLGYTPAGLWAVNRKSIALPEELRSKSKTPETPMVISGNLDPRGDGYPVASKMTTTGNCFKVFFS
jgi:homocysteine S-methyltransferase